MNVNVLTPERIGSGIAASRVLRNTYLLLSLTLGFAAIMAGISMGLNLPHPGIILTLAGYFGLLYLTSRFRNQGLGLVFVFGLTGFMGYTLGPVLNAYLGMSGGPQTVMTALAAAAITFVGLSGYALTTRRDFGFLGGMLFVGILVAFLAGLGAVLFEMPALSLAVSAMFVLLMSGLILFETQQIVRGGETNYIMATVTLFVAIFNLFTSLLHLFGFASQE